MILNSNSENGQLSNATRNTLYDGYVQSLHDEAAFHNSGTR